MKKRLGLVLLVFLAFLLSFAPNLCAEVGVTDTEIHLGQWGPQTGPAAAWGNVARGTGDYFKWINDNGGIHGRKIVYHMFDDGYNPAKTKAGVKNFRKVLGCLPGPAVWEHLQGLLFETIWLKKISHG